MGTLAAMPVKAAGDGDTAANSFNTNHYTTCFPNILTVINAGCMDWYVSSPGHMAPGRTGALTAAPTCMAYTGYNNCYVMSITVTATVTPLLPLTLTAGGTTYGGCHNQGGATNFIQDTSSVRTQSALLYLGVDEGAMYCGGSINFVVQSIAGSIIVDHIRQQIEFWVPYQDNINRICGNSDFANDVAHPDTASVLYPKENPCNTLQILDIGCGATGLTALTQTNTTQCTNPQIDNQNRLCAASNFGTDCNTPTINAALSGSITTTISGTLDILDRLCAASATGTACNQATISAVLSGTLDNLNRLCAASSLGASCTTPTVNAALTGVLDILDRLCGASATGTSCTAATVNTVLSGALNVHQDQACGASFATRCFGEVSGITVNQTVGSVTVPSNMTLNGGTIPIQVGNARGEFFLGVLLWLVAFFVCLRFSKLLSAAACSLGIIVSAFQLNLGWQAACIAILGVALWLEALGRDKIILAFFNPELRKQITD